MARVARSGVDTRSTEEVVSAWERMLLALIDAEDTRHPFDGSRRLVVFLKAQGQVVNRKRVQRLMGVLGLAGLAPLQHLGGGVLRGLSGRGAARPRSARDL